MVLLLQRIVNCSLELTINNDMVVFFKFKVIMAKRRRLKKIGGDLEAWKKNVISLELIICEQNVIPLEQWVNELSNPCGLKLAMEVVCNSNDEILSNTYWEFWSKNGLDCFKIYVHWSNAKKNCTKRFKFNYTCTFHHLMEFTGVFFQNFFIAILERN